MKFNDITPKKKNKYRKSVIIIFLLLTSIDANYFFMKMMWKCLELWLDKVFCSMCSLIHRN